MEHCLILLFLGFFSSTMGTAVEARVSSLEGKDNADLIQRIKRELLAETQEAEAKSQQEKNSFLAKMEEMEVESRNQRNDLYVKLQELKEWTWAQRDQILKRLTEVKMQCEDSTKNVAEKLQSAESRFLKIGNHVLMEVGQLKPKLKEAVEKVRSVEEELKTAFETERLKTQTLQVQMIELNSELPSVDLIRKDMLSVTDNLKLQLNESLTFGLEKIHSNLTKDLSIFENSKNFLKEYANLSYVSQLDENLKNLEMSSKNELMTLQSELSPRLEKLEEKSALCDDVPEMKKTLTNHSLRLNTLSHHLWKAEGYFDSSFILMTGYVHPEKITCHSNTHFQEISFSRVLDTGSGPGLPPGVSLKRQEGAVLDISTVERHKRTGVYECGYQVENRTVGIVVPYQRDFFPIRFHHISKVANIGEDIQIGVNLDRVDQSKVRWKHNGVLVRSWHGQQKVDISNVQPADAGIYECYTEENRIEFQGLFRLVVRKCGKNRYGANCEKECPICYSGGICHDHLGVCICTAGFTGKNCEFACGVNHVSSECAKICTGSDCRYGVFCKPDPYGCSCFPGYYGAWCWDPCAPGFYGADCRQICHCKNGPESCDIYTGACSGGCSDGWSGQSCQIKV